MLALHDGDLERACRLVACAQRIFEATGAIPDPDDHVELDRAVTRLNERLGERFADIWAAGQVLNASEAETLARR